MAAVERDGQLMPLSKRDSSNGGGVVDVGDRGENKTPMKVSHSEALPAAGGKFERQRNSGNDDYEDYDREEIGESDFHVPKIPEFKTPRRLSARVRWSDDDLSGASLYAMLLVEKKG